MITKINVDSSVPVYIQIEKGVQFEVASGRMKVSDKLPSVRELSESLQVNPNTVAKAYRELELMGIVTTRRGMGVFISQRAADICKPSCRLDSLTRLHEVTQEAKAAGMPKAEIIKVFQACYESDSGPYGDLPDVLTKSLKKKA